MPALGFLKKKRTREAGPNDSTSPVSASSQPGSPITSTTSKPFENSIASVTQSTAPSQPVPPSAPHHAEQSPVVAGEQLSMAQNPISQVQAPPQAQRAAPGTLPTINNMINPPQHDGAGLSIPEKKEPTPAASIGSAQTDTSTLQPSVLSSEPTQLRQTKGKYSLGDFNILRTLGTGSFGRVHLVQSKHNQRFYAVKVLKKAQVIKMKQVEHTNDERRMLQEVKHPFLITLWGTFQDSKNLYMVMDFVEGGELFSLLRKSQVRSPIPPMKRFTDSFGAIP